MEEAGLTPEILLRLEAEDWGVKTGVVEWSDWAKFMGVPVDARPLGLRNIDCKWQSGLEIFDCKYDVDWQTTGGLKGTYRRSLQSVGKENGIWSNDYIVVS
jgi:hypothetical protein